MTKTRATPPLARRRVGAQLRRWRETAKASAVPELSAAASPDAVVAKMGWDKPRLSRIEHGVYRVRAEEVRTLAQMYGIEDAEAVDEVARVAEQGPGWLAAYVGQISQNYQEYIELESAAREIRTHHTVIVPGVLQSPGYIREMITNGLTTVSASEAERLVQIRLARQEILSRQDPTQIHALVPESALHATFDHGPTTMRDQIRRLLDLSQMPRITLQIIPLTAHPTYGASGAMTLMNFAHPWPSVASVDNPLGGTHTEDPEQVEFIARDFDGVAGIALDESESRDILNRYLKG